SHVSSRCCTGFPQFGPNVLRVATQVKVMTLRRDAPDLFTEIPHPKYPCGEPFVAGGRPDRRVLKRASTLGQTRWGVSCRGGTDGRGLVSRRGSPALRFHGSHILMFVQW